MATTPDLRCAPRRTALARALLTAQVIALAAAAHGATPASAQLGHAECAAVRNSTGRAAELSAAGSNDFVLDRFHLQGRALPPGTLGCFLVARDAGFVPGFGGSVGNLCLGGALGRDSTQVLRASAAGEVGRRLALDAVPGPNGPFAVARGETLRFQLWYRDVEPSGRSVSNTSNALAVTFGTGAATYGEALHPTQPWARLEVGDMDLDGRVDVVSYGGTGEVVTHRCLGHRTFVDVGALDLGASVFDLRLGDLDGDGDLDAVAALRWVGRVALLENDGTGALALAATLGGLPDVARVRLADMDLDGDLDLLCAAAGGAGVHGTLTVLRNLGALQFAASAAYAAPQGVGEVVLGVGDLTSDGAPDVVVGTSYFATSATNRLAILANNGAGALQLIGRIAPVAATQFLDLVDVDGDGALDVVLSEVNTGSSSFTTYFNEVFRGDGTGAFPSRHLYPGSSFGSITGPGQDLDGDGDVDFIAWDLEGLLVLENHAGLLTAGASRARTGPTYELRFGLFDEDGLPDILITKIDSNHFGVRPMRPGLVIHDDEHVSLWPQPFEVTAADFDRDGDVDLVARWHSGGALLRNDGASFVVAQGLVALSGSLIQVLAFDLDGDLWPDLVGLNDAHSNLAGTTIVVRRNLGGFAFAPQTTQRGLARPSRAAHGDFDGDGREDLVVGSSVEASLALHANDGAGGFLAPTRIGLPGATRDVIATDIDLDGKLDLVAASSGPDAVAFLRGDGAGAFSLSATSAVPGRASGLVAADFDGDGAPDIAVVDVEAGTLQVLLNDGAGQFQALPPFAAEGAQARLSAGELTGDGRIDLVYVTDAAVVLPGLGHGAFGPPRAYAVDRPLQSALAVDLDGDGAQELAVTNSLIGGFVSILR